MISEELKCKVYDALWNIADNKFREENCCDFVNNQCVKDRMHKTVEHCCEGCKYLIEHKCSVKSLGCKLAMCQPIRERDVYMKGFMNALQKVKDYLEIPGHIRESREDVFK